MIMPNHNTLKEIEIKLYATNQTLEKIYKHTLFEHYASPVWQQKELLNRYVDTEDYALTAAKVALRVRKDGEQYIQTLKAKGHSLGGFSEREEFDWMINSPELDLSLLDSEHWPTSLVGLDKTTLKTIFATDFIRDYALFTWQSEQQAAIIEVAIDRGDVKAGHKQEPISELELELREGSASVMLEFAIELAKLFPLIPSDTSKAERGYRLITPASYQLPVTEQISTNPYQRVKYYLAVGQRLWESYLWQPEQTKLIKWLQYLQQLNIVLKELNVTHLNNLLNEIITDWQDIEENTAAKLQQRVQQEINNTRWGVFSLSTSHWLLNYH